MSLRKHDDDPLWQSRFRLRIQITGVLILALILTLVCAMFVFRLWAIAGTNRAQAQAGSTLAQQVIHACKADRVPEELRVLCDSAYKLITDPEEVLPRGISTVACLSDGTWRIVYTDGMRETITGTCQGLTGPVGPPGSVVVVTVTKTAPAIPQTK